MITVAPGAPAYFVVTSSLSTVSVGLPVTINAQAYDACKNKATNYTGTAQLWTNSPCPIADSNNGVWTGSTSVSVVGGIASQPVLLELAGNVYVTVAVGSTPTGVMQTPIDVTPDWFSAQHPDTAIQALAREDYYNNVNTRLVPPDR